MRSFLPRVSFDPDRLPALLAWLLRLMLGFDGRIDRRDFWAGSALVAALLLMTERVLSRHLPQHAHWAMLVVGAVAIYPFAALATKRGLDRGHGESWGVILVLCAFGAGAVAKALATKAFGHGPWALAASTCSLAIWLYSLVDLGLMPSKPQPHVLPRHVRAKAVGEQAKR